MFHFVKKKRKLDDSSQSKSIAFEKACHNVTQHMKFPFNWAMMHLVEFLQVYLGSYDQNRLTLQRNPNNSYEFPELHNIKYNGYHEKDEDSLLVILINKDSYNITLKTQVVGLVLLKLWEKIHIRVNSK